MGLRCFSRCFILVVADYFLNVFSDFYVLKYFSYFINDRSCAICQYSSKIY